MFVSHSHSPILPFSHSHSLALLFYSLFLVDWRLDDKYMKGESRVDVNAKDKHHWTPLHCAAYRQHLRTCEFLIKEANCNVCCLTSNFTTPLHYLVR
jgi:ankyrin repeat protein